MSDKTTINGWSISEGDYLIDYDYNELYKKSQRMKRINRGLMIASTTLGLIIITILTMIF